MGESTLQYYDTWPKLKKKSKKSRKKIYGLLAVLLLMGTGLIASKALNSNIYVVSYRLTSPKITGEPMRVVMFGDLHSKIFGHQQEELLQVIFAQDPDVVLLVGDIFDRKLPTEGAELLLDGLQGLPVYYVTGNHEYANKNYKQLMTILKEKGVVILNDDYQVFTNEKGSLILGGLNDSDALKKGLKIKTHKALLETYKSIKDSQYYSILLVHKPELYQLFNQYGFDLTVSGHTHGGQIRIPYLLNGLYAPDQGFFPERAGGLYQDPNMVHIVNRGLANTYYVPRLWNPPEICVIEIANT